MLKQPTHITGFGQVIAGGGDGTIVGGTGRFAGWTGTYTDRVFVEFNFSRSASSSVSSSSCYAEQADPRAERAMVRWLGRLFTEKRLEFALAAQCVELVAALRGPEAERAAGALGSLVIVPKEAVGGPSALLPWLILAAGLVLAGLTAALGVNATMRARAQAELAASRRRIVAASDNARRRIERDLHD